MNSASDTGSVLLEPIVQALIQTRFQCQGPYSSPLESASLETLKLQLYV